MHSLLTQQIAHIFVRKCLFVSKSLSAIGKLRDTNILVLLISRALINYKNSI